MNDQRRPREYRGFRGNQRRPGIQHPPLATRYSRLDPRPSPPDTRYAVPLFRSMQSVRELADFLGDYIRNGCTARCRPLPETAIYLWLLAAGILGDNVGEIVELAK